MTKQYFRAADILLPGAADLSRWAIIACDQYTSDPKYWEDVYSFAGGSPSALNMILPEIYLSQAGVRTQPMLQAMEEYRRTVLVKHADSMIYVERTLHGGAVRRGIVGAVDLEDYEFTHPSQALIRATEGTVLERIPPRVAIRHEAPLELPHVMLLFDDESDTVIAPLTESKNRFTTAYDFELMMGGGHIRGYFLDSAAQTAVNEALGALSAPAAAEEKYGAGASPMLFAVGDGNHSLAAAKAYYEEIKASEGAAAANHPARYALVEIVNIHERALDFEPIHRVLFGVDPEHVLAELAEYSSALKGGDCSQGVGYIHSGSGGNGISRGRIEFKRSPRQLAAGTIEDFIEIYLIKNPGASVDYIHGDETASSLGKAEGRIAFLLDSIDKRTLFGSVIRGGALTKKSFSMGHANDKRFYLEGRLICREIFSR